MCNGWRFATQGQRRRAATYVGLSRLDRRSVPQFYKPNGASVASSFVIRHLLSLGASDANGASVANGASDAHDASAAKAPYREGG